MENKKNAEIPGKPSDSTALLNENVPVWETGTGKDFSAGFPEKPDVKNIDTASIVQLMLPKIVYAETGIETRIYFHNLVLAYDKSILKFSVECDVGINHGSYWSFTPDKPGEYRLKIITTDSAERVVGEAETIVKAASADNGNDQNIVAMIVGDSIFGNGKIADFLQEGMILRGNHNFRLMGSHSGQGAPLAIGKAAVEAYGGWCWDTFMTLWKPGEEYNVRTKFMKMSGEKLEPAVQEYLDKYNAGKAPDIVIFALGCNNIACASMGNIEAQIRKAEVDRTALLSMFRSAMPETLFGVVLLAPPNGRENAFEINYKGLIPRRQYLYNQFSYVKTVMETLQDSGEISLIPFYTGVDEFSDYPEDNAVHPNETGQRRLALMLEAWLKNLNYH